MSPSLTFLSYSLTFLSYYLTFLSYYLTFLSYSLTFLSYYLTPLSPDCLQVICGSVHLLDGGFQFDGQTTIKPINDDEVIECISQIKQSGVKNIVVAGVFAPLNTGQEEHVSLTCAWPKQAQVLSYLWCYSPC